MQRNNVHWMGLVSGLLLTAVILLSLYHPWWQLRIGDLGYANASPLSANLSFLGTTFVVPVLTAMNVSSLLLLSISAALMIAYSLNPTKPYAKQLLCWSYTKPFVILIMFLGGLVALSLLVPYMANQYAQLDVTLPIMGTSMFQVPPELLGGVSGVQIGIAVSGAFQWTFYLAIVAAVLCVATRIHYGKAFILADSGANATATSSELLPPVQAVRHHAPELISDG